MESKSINLSTLIDEEYSKILLQFQSPQEATVRETLITEIMYELIEVVGLGIDKCGCVGHTADNKLRPKSLYWVNPTTGNIPVIIHNDL